MIRIDLKGEKALIAALKNMSAEVEAKVGSAVMETAANIEAEVKLGIMQGPASGAIYYRIDNGNGTTSIFANDDEGYVGTFRSVPGMKATHQASAAGEAPMSDTGALAGSVYHQKEGPLTATVGSRMDYAAYLEFGTISMNPRPIWQPTILDEQPRFRNRVAKAVGVAVK